MKFFLLFSFFVLTCQAQNLTNVKICFFASLNDTKCIGLDNLADFSTINSRFYNSTKKNMMFALGFQPADSIPTRDLVVGAFLNCQNTNYNSIELDWSAYAGGNNGFDVVQRINPVIGTVNQILTSLRQQGINIANFYGVGHSYGALIVGGVSRYFKNQFNLPFFRITACEPPESFGLLGPFLATNNVSKLDKNDALFVDVIHSNAYSFGDAGTRGKIDFWPNGGMWQPGCPGCVAADGNKTILNWNTFVASVGCDHGRSYMYFAESVCRTLPSLPFKSIRCSKWALGYDQNQCKLASNTSMGFWAQATYTNPENLATVHFYLPTNSATTFSKT